MAKTVRPAHPGMSYVTTATRERRPIFEIARVAELFIDTLLHYRTLGHYKLHAYVVMPDHVHLLITPQSITLEQAVALIKNGFAHRLDSKLPIWDDGTTAYPIATMYDLEIVRAHLHQLPVRARLVPAAELYPHSSAYRLVPPQKSAASPVTDAESTTLHKSPRRSTLSPATSLRRTAS